MAHEEAKFRGDRCGYSKATYTRGLALQCHGSLDNLVGSGVSGVLCFANVQNYMSKAQSRVCRRGLGPAASARRAVVTRQPMIRHVLGLVQCNYRLSTNSTK